MNEQTREIPSVTLHTSTGVEVDATPVVVAMHETVTEVVTRFMSFSGPLPLPSTLAEYAAIAPGLDVTIVEMALKEQEHRHECDRAEIKMRQTKVDTNRDIVGLQRVSLDVAKRGQTFGFVLAALVMVLAGALAFDGHETAGITFAGIDAAGLASVFVFKNLDTLLGRIRRNAPDETDDEGN